MFCHGLSKLITINFFVLFPPNWRPSLFDDPMLHCAELRRHYGSLQWAPAVSSWRKQTVFSKLFLCLILCLIKYLKSSVLFPADSRPLADGHPTRPGFRPAVRTSSWPQRHLTRLRRHSPALWWRPLHRRSYKYFRLSYWPGPRAAVTTLAGISAQSVFRPHPQDQPALSPTAQQPVPLFGLSP